MTAGGAGGLAKTAGGRGTTAGGAGGLGTTASCLLEILLMVRRAYSFPLCFLQRKWKCRLGVNLTIDN